MYPTKNTLKGCINICLAKSRRRERKVALRNIKSHDIWKCYLQCWNAKQKVTPLATHFRSWTCDLNILAKSSQTSLSSHSELLKNVPPLVETTITKNKTAQNITGEWYTWASRFAPAASRSEEVKTQFRRKRRWQSHGRRHHRAALVQCCCATQPRWKRIQPRCSQR